MAFSSVAGLLEAAKNRPLWRAVLEDDLAERGAEEPEAMRDFDRLGYAFSPEWSEEDLYVFLRESRPGRRP